MAKDSPSAQMRAEVITRWMKQRLELTSQQISRVEVLNLKYEKQIDKVTATNVGFPCMQAVRDTIKEKEKHLKKLLTPTQFVVYREGKNELKEQLKRCKNKK